MEFMEEMDIREVWAFIVEEEEESTIMAQCMEDFEGPKEEAEIEANEQQFVKRNDYIQWQFVKVIKIKMAFDIK